MNNVFLIADEEKSFCDYLLNIEIIEKRDNIDVKTYNDISSMLTSSIFDLFGNDKNTLKLIYFDNKKSIGENIDFIVKEEEKIENNLRSDEMYVFVLSGDKEQSLKRYVEKLNNINIDFKIISPFSYYGKNKKRFISNEFEKQGLNKKVIEYILQSYTDGKNSNYYSYIPLLNFSHKDKDFVNLLNNAESECVLQKHITSFVPNFSKELISLWDWRNALNISSFNEFSKQMMKVFNNHSHLIVYKNIYNDMSSLYRENVTNNYSWHRKTNEKKLSLEKIQKIIHLSRSFYDNVLFGKKMSSDASLFIVSIYSIINDNK